MTALDATQGAHQRRPAGRSARATSAGTSLWQGAFQRLRRNPSAIIGAAIVALLVLVAVFAPLLAPYEPATSEWIDQVTPSSVPGPSPEHPLGLDPFGSDMLTQLIYGARQSLVIGIVSTMIGVIGGATLGVLAGGLGGWWDTGRDAFRRHPAVHPLAAARGQHRGGARPATALAIMIAIGVAQVPIFARLLRGSMLGQRGQDYVLAAVLAGAAPTHGS